MPSFGQKSLSLRRVILIDRFALTGAAPAQPPQSLSGLLRWRGSTQSSLGAAFKYHFWLFPFVGFPLSLSPRGFARRLSGCNSRKNLSTERKRLCRRPF